VSLCELKKLHELRTWDTPSNADRQRSEEEIPAAAQTVQRSMLLRLTLEGIYILRAGLQPPETRLDALPAIQDRCLFGG